MYVDAVFGEPVDVDGDFEDRHVDVDNDGIGIAAPRAGLASESARAPISSEFELEPMDDAGGSGLRPHQSSSAARSSSRSSTSS